MEQIDLSPKAYDPDMLFFVQEYAEACKTGLPDVIENAYCNLRDQGMNHLQIMHALGTLEQEMAPVGAGLHPDIEMAVADMVTRLREAGIKF